MTHQANAHCCDFTFVVDDQILVSLQPFRQNSIGRQRQHKSSKKFYGSFCITECIGQVMYHLYLSESNHVHLIFHVSNLKNYHDPVVTPSSELPVESFENQPIKTPLAIAATHIVLYNEIRSNMFSLNGVLRFGFVLLLSFCFFP